jgi:hypothetical protein
MSVVGAAPSPRSHAATVAAKVAPTMMSLSFISALKTPGKLPAN